MSEVSEPYLPAISVKVHIFTPLKKNPAAVKEEPLSSTLSELFLREAYFFLFYEEIAH